MQLFHLLCHLTQIVAVPICATTHIVEHELGVWRHVEWFTAQCYDSGHTCSNPIDIDGDICFAIMQRLVDRQTSVHVATDTIDAHINLAIRAGEL